MRQRVSMWTLTFAFASCLAIQLSSCTALPDVVQACAGDADCLNGHTCAEGRCVPVDASRLDTPRAGETAVAPVDGDGGAQAASDAASREAATPVMPAVPMSGDMPMVPVTPAMPAMPAMPTMPTMPMDMSEPAMPLAGSCPAGACANGRCEPTATGYRCICDSGFEPVDGTSCRNVDDCPRDACGAHGRCVDGVNDYACVCELGFQLNARKQCVEANDCLPGVCEPGGTCKDLHLDWQCVCNPGFSGTGTQLCVNIDDCRGNPCAPGGVCIDGVQDYECDCALESPDPKTCPFTRVEEGTYDARTGLIWPIGYAPFRAEAVPSMAAAEEARAHCAQTGAGYRWATEADVQQIPGVVFSPPDLCFYTPSGVYCPPGSDPNAGTYKVHCVRQG